jgi:alpha-L-rhamnosidase
VTNCTFRAGHGVVTLGSEACIIRDVVVEHCTITGKIPMARLKLRPDTPQIYENIHFRDITLVGSEEAARADLFEIAPWSQFFDLQGQERPKSVVRNVTLTDIRGSYGSFGDIKGNPGQTEISDITLRNMDVRLESEEFAARQIGNLKIENVRVNGKPFALKPAN